MTLSEVAKAFGMSIKDFANYIGYTRQALYANGLSFPMLRANAIRELLTYRSQQMYDADVREAERKRKERKETISVLLDGGDGNG